MIFTQFDLEEKVGKYSKLHLYWHNSIFIFLWLWENKSNYTITNLIPILYFLWRWYIRVTHSSKFSSAVFVYCRKLIVGVCNYSVVNISKYTIALFIHVFLCPKCPCIYLYCIPITYYCEFVTLPYKQEVMLAIKLGSTHHFCFKYPVPSQEYSSCFIIVPFYVYCIGVCFCCI